MVYSREWRWEIQVEEKSVAHLEDQVVEHSGTWTVAQKAVVVVVKWVSKKAEY